MTCCKFNVARTLLVVSIPLVIGPLYCYDNHVSELLGHYAMIGAMLFGGLLMGAAWWVFRRFMPLWKALAVMPLLGIAVAACGQQVFVRTANPPVNVYPGLMLMSVATMVAYWMIFWWVRLGKARPIAATG